MSLSNISEQYEIAVKRFMEQKNCYELPLRTPWKYMNWRQLRQALKKLIIVLNTYMALVGSLRSGY